MKIVREFNRYITVFFFLTIAVICATAYFTFNEVLSSHNKRYQESLIPLFSLINTEVVKPLLVANFIANDEFLIRSLQGEEFEAEVLTSYLQKLSDNNTLLTFVASERHQQMIDSNGKHIDFATEKAEWYFRLKSQPSEEFTDIGDSDNPRLYIDIKIRNDQGQFIGFAGVATELTHFAEVFSDYKARFGYDFLFTNDKQEIMLASDSLMRTESHHRRDNIVNISNLSWYSSYRRQMDKNTSINTVAIPKQELIVTSMPLVEFDWTIYLMAKPTQSQSEYVAVFIEKAIPFLLVVLALYVAMIFAIRYFDKTLAERATVDSLTHLPNRQNVQWQYDQLTRSAKSVAVVLANVDNFKVINDQYGRVFGDEVLTAIANKLRNELGLSDILGRWEGVEFIIIVPDIDSNRIMAAIEQIRRAMADTPVARRGADDIMISMSFGIATSSPPMVMGDMIMQADAALSRAKTAGRNRTEINDN